MLEPLFTAAFHGIELSFILLSEFIKDGRNYIAKRPRIERVAADITSQCKLITEVIDAELEEDLVADQQERLSLTQPFPFEKCPPTTQVPGRSPGIGRLVEAVTKVLTGPDKEGDGARAITVAERNSLVKLVLNISNAFLYFQRWTVGIGIEHQIDELRGAVGLPPQYDDNIDNSSSEKQFLDYNALVQPDIVEQTLTQHNYTHAEDFFFRSIHLGTDCWAFIALERLQSAKSRAAVGDWHVAAARALQAAAILNYLGDHVMLLTSMNLRDYLILKVEIQGTSGEGSVQVKSFRKAVEQLAEPLWREVLLEEHNRHASVGAEEKQGEGDEVLKQALLHLYAHPYDHPGIYNFAKALEDVESALLGGFYYKHYLLATNVIGSEARGTMQRAVQALKAIYEKAVFPQLDKARVALGVHFDTELAANKGKIMDDILKSLENKLNGVESSVAITATATATAFTSTTPLPTTTQTTTVSPFEAARRDFYSWDKIPLEFKTHVFKSLAQHTPKGAAFNPTPPSTTATFLDHAWGGVAPKVMYNAMVSTAALLSLGNPSWDVIYGVEMPTAARYIKSLLGINNDEVTVQFGHNSHELVWRLLSSRLHTALSTGTKLRMISSDQEFYSLTRQVNRLVDVIDLEVVPVEPVGTFQQRCLEAIHQCVGSSSGEGEDSIVVYVSQITFLKQQTLLPSPAEFVHQVDAIVAAAAGGRGGRADSKDDTSPTSSSPLVIIDGYHAFAAIPTNLSLAAAKKSIYVGGVLKHAGCGPNMAFATVPRHFLSPCQSMSLEPTNTGWLADPSVLSPGADGVKFGDNVGYLPDLALQGGTPSYVLPLLMFNELMRKWSSSLDITSSTTSSSSSSNSCVRVLESLHQHVTGLQDYFLSELSSLDSDSSSTKLKRENYANNNNQLAKDINVDTLVPPADDNNVRSHTLVFCSPCGPAGAAAAVEMLREGYGVVVDCRGSYVRIGFGAHHSVGDVDILLNALKKSE